MHKMDELHQSPLYFYSETRYKCWEKSQMAGNVKKKTPWNIARNWVGERVWGVCDLTGKGIKKARGRGDLNIGVHATKRLDWRNCSNSVTIIQELESTATGRGERDQFYRRRRAQTAKARGFWLAGAHSHASDTSITRSKMQIIFAPQLAGPICAILSRRQGAQHAPTGSLFHTGSKWGECLFWLSILGRGRSGSLAEVGMAPSLRLDPRGARFAHPPSLNPHATEANGQDWRAVGSRGAPKMPFIIGPTRNQKSLNLAGTFLATRQGKWAPLPVFFF